MQELISAVQFPPAPNETGAHGCQFQHLTLFCSPFVSISFIRCKRRIRTFTRRLAKAQELISSGQSSLIRFVYPVIPTLETGGHGCQFQHLTLLLLYQKP